MRNLFWVLVTGLMISGCDEGYNRVEGNGVIQTKEKSLNRYDELEVSGAFKVKIVPSDNYRVVIEADENLQSYIRVDQDGDRVRIKMKNNINVRTSKPIRVTVFAGNLRRIELAGSCDLKSDGLIEHPERIELTIAGSGDANIEVKTPVTKVSIGGSGKVIINGKTRDLDLSIAGSGDFEGADLLSETSEVSIAGSGSAKVYASVELKVSIAGSGDVYYGGNPPSVKKSIAGVGNVKPLSTTP